MSLVAESHPTPRKFDDAETARLFEAYADRMLAYCTRRLRSRSDAEDAVQTTFLYAMRALRRGVEPECESAWLHTIARNVCNWQERTAGRRPVVCDFEIESLACAQTDEDVELLSGLRDALGSLPPNQQRALVLREWHGVPAREIAVELGLTAPQTHALLTRARRSLAHALTAPRRAALGLGGLAFAFRARLEALAGGAAIKAAAIVSIAAVGSAGVGGATSESGARSERAGREEPAAVLGGVTGGVSDGASSVPAARRSASTRPRGTASTPAQPSGDLPAAASSAPPAVAGVAAESSSAPDGGNVPALKPPTLELPAVQAPPFDLPRVAVPPVELPGVNAGPVSTPPVNVPAPTVELPPVEIPPVDLPPVEAPAVPLPPLPPLPPALPR